MGYVLTQREERESRKNTNLTNVQLSGDVYYQVTGNAEACVTCLDHNGAIYPIADAKVGINLPPFHPNCKCSVQGYSLENPNLDPWKAEIVFWLEMMYGALSLQEKTQKLVDYYGSTKFSHQFIARVLSVIDDIGHITKRMEAFFSLLENAPNMIGIEMGLPADDVDYSMFRWENYSIFSATSNQKKMQDMAYTDEEGFRRIDIQGLEQPAYMAALATYYVTDEDGTVNPNGVVFRVYLSNGHSFYVVSGDVKADRDTDSDNHQYTYNLSYGVDKTNADVIEFIIDEDNMQKTLWGDNFRKGEPSWLQAEIIRIERLDITVL